MVQYIKQGDIFGRIGTGVGKGLAEQLPKAAERGRLSAALKDIGERTDQTPFQRFTGLASQASDYPQIIQSGERILNQEARGRALARAGEDQNQPKPNPFSNIAPQQSGQPNGKPPSITQEKPLSEIQEGYIPPTKEQEFTKAGQLYNKDPEKFGNDPQKALDFVEQGTIRDQAINESYEKKHANLNNIQDNVVSRLKAQSERLSGGKSRIPAELYSKIEDKAIQATKSKKEGGEGLTEQQAMKKYGDELNDAERDFSKIDEIGNWGITLRPANESLRSMKSLQERMESIGQTDNYAKELISKAKLSPQMAYGVAEPVRMVQKLNLDIKGLRKLQEIGTPENNYIPDNPIEKTLEIAPKLARHLKNEEKASPLAIAYELQKKGYDPQTWLQYVTDHAKELNLRQRQSEQAETPLNITTPWNDWWLKSFSGID